MRDKVVNRALNLMKLFDCHFKNNKKDKDWQSKRIIILLIFKMFMCLFMNKNVNLFELLLIVCIMSSILNTNHINDIVNVIK